MSNKHRHVLESIFRDPIRNNLHWREVESLLRHLGAEVETGHGAIFHVRLNRHEFTVHHPHHEHLPPHVVLVVPHHGGSPEACRLLAEAIRPETSVISVGRNTYGHPRAQAVAALGSTGRVLRTDRDGAIFLRSDARRWEVRTWRELTNGRTWAERRWDHLYWRPAEFLVDEGYTEQDPFRWHMRYRW